MFIFLVDPRSLHAISDAGYGRPYIAYNSDNIFKAKAPLSELVTSELQFQLTYFTFLGFNAHFSFTFNNRGTCKSSVPQCSLFSAVSAKLVKLCQPPLRGVDILFYCG